MKIRSKFLHISGAVAFTLASSFALSPASAVPITYTITGIGSGDLFGTGFSDKGVTVVLNSDTTTVTPSGGLLINNGTGSVTIAGLGTSIFTDTMFAYVNQSVNAAGIASVDAGASVLATFNGAFSSYNLAAAIGPLTGSTFFDPSSFYGTDSGLLSFSQFGDSTFTASVSQTPVPVTWPITMLVFAGMTYAARRKAARRT